MDRATAPQQSTLLARAWLLAGMVAVVMIGALTYGVVEGDLTTDGARLTQNPWGIVTLVECYLGFCLIGAWMVHRESSRAKAAVWVIALMLIGHLVTAAYLVRAAGTSGGRLETFWMGTRAE